MNEASLQSANRHVGVSFRRLAHALIFSHAKTLFHPNTKSTPLSSSPSHRDSSSSNTSPSSAMSLAFLNDRYRRLIAIKLHDCKSVSKYAQKFKELHNDILNMSECLRLEENFLIFLFHRGLGNQHESYVTKYTQNHAAVDSDGKAAFTLEYAIQRFMQTVSNPWADRSESSLGMATPLYQTPSCPKSSTRER